MSEPTKIWVRSIAHHTYWNIAQPPGTFYAVDTQQDADTVVALKLAVLDSPPTKAQRAPETAAAPEPSTPVAPLTTGAFPSAPTRRKS